jgi:hypothetical protein
VIPDQVRTNTKKSAGIRNFIIREEKIHISVLGNAFAVQSLGHFRPPERHREFLILHLLFPSVLPVRTLDTASGSDLGPKTRGVSTHEPVLDTLSLHTFPEGSLSVYFTQVKTFLVQVDQTLKNLTKSFACSTLHRWTNLFENDTMRRSRKVDFGVESEIPISGGF